MIHTSGDILNSKCHPVTDVRVYKISIRQTPQNLLYCLEHRLYTGQLTHVKPGGVASNFLKKILRVIKRK